MSRVLCCAVLFLAIPVCLFAQDQDPVGIVVMKDVDVSAAPFGYEVTYTIAVENQTEGVLMLDYVSDTLFGDITGLFGPELHPGVTEMVELPYVLQYGDPDPLYNSVDFAYTDEWGDMLVDDDQATVDILHPQFESFFECPNPPPPPGEDVMITVGLSNVGDVTMVITIVSPPEFPDPFTLGVGETLTFLTFTPCVGDMACVDVVIITDLPPEYGISFPHEIAFEACCPCNGSPVEDSTWGVIKALYR